VDRFGRPETAAADHDIILDHHERFWATMKVEFYDRYLWPTMVAAIGDGARAKCSKRPASLWAQDEAVPLGSVVAVVVAESPDHYARDQIILHTAGDLVAAHQVSSGAQDHLLA
jgi:hypothetical protein